MARQHACTLSADRAYCIDEEAAEASIVTVRVLVALVVIHDGAEGGVGVADGMIAGPTANR
jgi:hypothetical protein